MLGKHRHVDSAQVYRNEAHVGEAVKESNVPREDIFLSKFSPLKLASHSRMLSVSHEMCQ